MHPNAYEFTPYGWPEPGPRFLAPTSFLDFNTPEVERFARDAVTEPISCLEQMARLFLVVRDRVGSDSYAACLTPECFSASAAAVERSAFCVLKAVLLAAGARLLGIPAAIGLSDVVNHCSTPKLRQMMDSRTVFMRLGWAAGHRKGPPTAFDDTSDAVPRQYKEDGAVQMEHLRDPYLPYLSIDSDRSGYYPSEL